MEFINQKEAILDLKRYAESDKHTVLISGVSGSGKSYLAMQYAKFLKIDDSVFVEPKVNNLKDGIAQCIVNNKPIVFCIENLDTGVSAASYSILKFIEEPMSNIYIVITCRNIKQIPDTILSRSCMISLCPPTNADIDSYAKKTDLLLYERLHEKSIWKCVHSFKEVDELYKYSVDEVEYIENIVSNISSNNNVSSIVWAIQKLPSGKDAPIHLVLKHIADLDNRHYIHRCCIECLNDIDSNVISKNAAIAKFVFDYKYA